MAESNPQVVIIGGGLTGLACAQRLLGLGIEPLLVEASGRVGGKIRTVIEDGYEFEAGPNTLLASNPALLALIDEVGLADQIIETAPSARKRYILHRGQLLAAPLNPMAALTSPLLGPCGIAEALGNLWRKPPADIPRDETVASFIRRHFGQRILENLVAPFLAGVYGGDAEQLEARSTLKKLVEAEKLRGSVIRGLIALRKKNASGGQPKPKRQRSTRSITFAGGLAALPQRVADRLGPRVRLNSSVSSIAADANECAVTLETGEIIRARKVVIATETATAARLIETIPHANPGVTADLRAIPAAGIAVVGLAFPHAAVTHPLDGFGYLAGAGSTSPVLGCFFRTTIFPHTAPAGPPDMALLVSFVGGAKHDIAGLSDEQLVNVARAELGRNLGIAGAPARIFFERWPVAIPQFVRGHAARAERITHWSHGGRVSIISSGVYGVALPLCVETGRREAARIAKKDLATDEHR